MVSSLVFSFPISRSAVDQCPEEQRLRDNRIGTPLERGAFDQRRRLLIALGLTWGFAVVEAFAGWQPL